MQRLEVSGAVRPIYGSLGFKRLRSCINAVRAFATIHKQLLSTLTLCTFCALSSSVQWTRLLRDTGGGFIEPDNFFWFVTSEFLFYSHFLFIYRVAQKCIHSLLINIFGINLNEISISG